MNSDSLVVYKSSAGSGKTSSLVIEYLRITLPEPSRFSEIVAITFTIKATNEMKSRVIHTLNSIKSGNPKPEINNLLSELQFERGLSNSDIRKNAEQLLSNILHNYSFFAFSTIDSFVTRIVRSFAFDLKLPLNFGIELNSNLIIEEAVNSLLSEAGYDNKLTTFLVDYIRSQAENERSTRIPKLLADLSQILFKESYSDFVVGISNSSKEEILEFANRVITNTSRLKREISNLGVSAQNMISQAGLVDKDFFQGSKGIYKYFEYLTLVKEDKISPNSYVIQTIENGKWHSGSASVSAKSSIDSIAEALTSIYFEAQTLIARYLTFYVINRNIEPLALLKFVQDMIHEFYFDNNVIHLSETIKRVSEVVDNEPIPFIFERIGNQYSHYLIDEFQDTSRQQWRNLLPLIENSLSEGNFNMIVGDAKQSIYRWRGANFRQFVELPEVDGSQDNTILKRRQKVISQHYKPIVLDTNYRSSKSVVDFNNGFYEFMCNKNFANDLVQKVFTDFHQKQFSTEAGFVEVEFAQAPKENPDALSNSLMRMMNDLIDRNIDYNDIAILSRKNANLAQIAQILLNNGIPVISSDSLSIKSSPHISFVLDFLRWIHNSLDQVSLLGLLNYLLENKHIDKSLFHQIISSPQRNSISFVCQFLGLDSRNFDRDDVEQTTQFIVSRFSVLDADYAFVSHLLNFIRKSVRAVGRGISNFLNYFEQYADNEYITMPDDLNAVQLLSIHKSKGLEFPVVIFVDFPVWSGSNKGEDFLLVPTEKIGLGGPKYTLIENNKVVTNTNFNEYQANEQQLHEVDLANIAYVATTRARIELFILTLGETAYSQLLAEYCHGFLEEVSGSENAIFFIGEKSKFQKETLTNQIEQLSYSHFRPWYDKVSLNKSFLIPADENFNKSEKLKGTEIHNLLRQMNTSTDLLGMLQNKDIALTNNEIELISSIINNKEVGWIFDHGWKVFNEKQILSSNRKLYRPDRVQIRNNEILVVDYKWSNPNENTDYQVNGYRDQLQNYAKLLSEMYPNFTVRKYLFWLKENLVLQEV